MSQVNYDAFGPCLRVSSGSYDFASGTALDDLRITDKSKRLNLFNYHMRRTYSTVRYYSKQC